MRLGRTTRAGILAVTLAALVGVVMADDGGKTAEKTPTPEQLEAQRAAQATMIMAGVNPAATMPTNAPPVAPPPESGGDNPGSVEAVPADLPVPPRGQETKTESAVGDYQMNVDAEARMLRIYEQGRPDNQQLQVIVGEEFVTDIGFDNKAQIPFDAVRVILSYDAETFEPVAVNDSAIAPSIVGEPTAEFDGLYGQLLYEAALSGPVTLDRKPILSIRWKAKRVVMESKLEFSSRQEYHTALTNKGRDILGSARDPGDGTLNMVVTVLPEDPREAAALLTDPSVYQHTTDKIGGVRLSLVPQPEPIIVGEPFYVDVVLDNRIFSMLDGVNLLIAFDPDVIQVADADKDNWITRETNVLDGPFREMFPWDLHIDNIVYQGLGLIKYRVATTDGEMTRGKMGPIARIYAIAKRPTEGSPLVFKFSKRPRSHATGAVYVGEDTLGDSKDPFDGAVGALIRVAPAPLAQVAGTQTSTPGEHD
ncbi:hypothetical protein GC173_02315 [bacterium]|nr:hypothetical protein [bacterium]